LLRLKEENIGLPWTNIADYLTNPKTPLYHDGHGLNPLLQNYWMTIHPPTLFLGFACVPFHSHLPLQDYGQNEFTNGKNQHCLGHLQV